MRCGCVGVRLRSRTRARPSLPRRMTTHDAASVAEAESFAARLESLAASIPPARPLEAPLVASVPFRDGTTAAHRAAVAFERLVGGEDPRTTWYSAGKRHLHQPQLEALARLVAPMAESSDDPRDERVVLELGAGQALLGRLVSRITSAPLVAVDRRDTGDAPRSSHDDGHEDEKDDASAPAAESDPHPEDDARRGRPDALRVRRTPRGRQPRFSALPQRRRRALRRRRRQAPVRGRHRRRRSPRRRRRHATPRSRRRCVSRARALLPSAYTPRRIQRGASGSNARGETPGTESAPIRVLWAPRGSRAFWRSSGDEGARGRVRRDAGEAPREIAGALTEIRRGSRAFEGWVASRRARWNTVARRRCVRADSRTRACVDTSTPPRVRIT